MFIGVRKDGGSMRKYILIMLLLGVCFNGLYASELEREMTFKEGVSAYVTEDYSNAIEIFHGLIEEGLISWELYYNLGNTYYRQGELGNAIRYWEKARIIAPEQEDIIYNLAIAEQRLIDKVVLPDVFPLFKWYNELKLRINLSHLVFYIGLLLFISLLLVSYNIYRKRRYDKKMLKSSIVALCILFSTILIFASIGIDASVSRKDLNHAIILDNTVNIYSEPDEDSQVLFVLHEGSKVKINKKIENIWMNISYFDDKIGWIKTVSIGGIEE